MCFHWVATFGFDGADVRKENRIKKKKKDDTYDSWEGFKANLAFNNWN